MPLQRRNILSSLFLKNCPVLVPGGGNVCLGVKEGHRGEGTTGMSKSDDGSRNCQVGEKLDMIRA